MKIKRSHRLYLALLILFFVFRTAAIHHDITNLNYQKNSPACGYAI
jgi:hypothetical protein